MDMNGCNTVNATHDNSNHEDDGPTFNDDNVNEQQDRIAWAMWDDYQKVCQERAQGNIGSTDGSTESDSNDDGELDVVL